MNIKKEEKNVLYSLQKLFNDMSNADINIKYINIKYINPIYFINNYDDEIININEEKDVHEFFLDLMGRLKKD